MAAGRVLKIILVGDSCVAKDEMLLYFAVDKPDGDLKPTIGVNFRCKTVEHDRKKITLQIWDIAGHDRFCDIDPSYYRGAHGVVLVYDITKKETFQNIETSWWTDSGQYVGSDAVRMLVGINCEKPLSERQVPTDRAKKFAEEKKIFFLEVSARTNFNVKEAFMELTKAILDKMPYL